MHNHARQPDAPAEAPSSTERAHTEGELRQPGGATAAIAHLAPLAGSSRELDGLAADEENSTRTVGILEGVADAPSLSPRKMRPWTRTLTLAIAALAAGVLAWLIVRNPPAPGGGPAHAMQPLELAAVDVATVEPRVLTRLLPLSGTIAPFVQATVKSRVGGPIEQVTIREGQDVRRGDIIARLDTRNLQARYDRELAAVEKAQADLELASLNREKNRALLEQRFISRNTYESTESAYAASLASFKLAQAQARLAKLDLDDALIRAPFDGTIAARLVQPGETVAPDASIVTLVDLRQMVLEAAVPAAEIPSVRIGQKVSFQVGGFGEREFQGEVQRINPVTVGGSRAITLYIAVPNADRALKGGMFAQGELTLDATQPVLAVAERAVHEESGASYVYTLRDGKIVRTPVRLGPSIDGHGFREVREGLSPGERVILAQIEQARAGSQAIVRGERDGVGRTNVAASDDRSEDFAASR